MAQLAFIGNLAGPDMIVLLLLFIFMMAGLAGAVGLVLFVMTMNSRRSNLEARLKAIEEKLDRLADKAAS
jgi:hypothetical protein